MRKLITFIFLIVVFSIHSQTTQEIYNRTYLLKEKRKMHQALPLYQTVLQNNPKHMYAHIGIAQVYLALGNYINGWQELEWRLGSPPDFTKHARNYIQTHTDLTNKIILIRAEWGMGDTIQMLRYVKLLKERGAIIKFATLHKRLIPLLQLQPYIDEVIPPNQPRPPFHIQIPLMSLPMVFKTTLKTIPQTFPYIQIEPNRIAKWNKHFEKNTHFKIGICWEGNTIHDKKKFMPLAQFIELAAIPNIQLISLQKREGLEQIKQLQHPKALYQFDRNCDSDGAFLDTAAILQELDLVITVDTSIAHLAGALNVPVWIALPKHADWRWLLLTNKSPWYPSIMLFRQKHIGTWDNVIQDIIVHLQALLETQKVSKL